MSKRKNQIEGPFVPRTIEMLCSPAFGALTLAGHRILARIEIEHAHHGGRDNGRLAVTFANFESFGLHRMAIGPGIREACALGFLEVTRRGRSGIGEQRTPNLFRLTYLPTERAATNEWRTIKTVEDANKIARAARRSGKENIQFTSPGKRTGFGTENVPATTPGKRTESAKSPPPENVPLSRYLSIYRGCGAKPCAGGQPPSPKPNRTRTPEHRRRRRLHRRASDGSRREQPRRPDAGSI